MTVAAFCRSLKTHWQALTEYLWPESPQQQTQAEITRLTAELNLRQDRLVARRQRIEILRDRLRLQQQRLEECSLSGIPVDNLPDLDRLRRAVNRNRLKLRRLEQAYSRQRDLFDQRKALRLALAQGEIVAVRKPARHEEDS